MDITRVQAKIGGVVRDVRTSGMVNGVEIPVTDLTSSPKPVSSVTWGACPTAGGESFNAATTVVTKWDGDNMGLRQFFGALQPVHWPDGVKIVHASFTAVHLPPTSISSGALDAAITSWASTVEIPDGCVLFAEWCHEIDSKIRSATSVSDGVITLAKAIPAKIRWYELIKAARPEIMVPLTLTAWLLEPHGSAYSSHGDYYAMPCDYLGIDLDGIAGSGGTFPDYSEEIRQIATEIPKYAGNPRGWVAPEVGAGPDPTDTTDSLRALWLAGLCQMIEDYGPRYAMLYDYAGGTINDRIPESSPAYPVWKTRVQMNPESV